MVILRSAVILNEISFKSAQGDTTSESMMQARELIERSCMTDSQHLYQIVAEFVLFCFIFFFLSSSVAAYVHIGVDVENPTQEFTLKF